MIGLQRIRDEADLIRAGAAKKGETAPIDELLELDTQARKLRTTVESLRAEQRRTAEAIQGKPTEAQLVELTNLKRQVHDGEERLTALDAQVNDLLLYIPNPPHESVPLGTSDADNVVIRTWGEKPSFSFTPVPHYELGDKLGVFDFERAAKVSGSRFAFVLGDGAKLKRALITFMVDVANEHGYSEVSPPFLVRRESMVGTGNLPKFEDEAFHADGDLFLIPTAEVPVTNMYRDEILDGSRLPIAHVAYSPCFRSEAGAAGKDTRGYIRMHQFEKVELVRFTTPESSLEELEKLTQHAETVLQRLGIHYRVLSMCTGDMGFAQWKKYDLEAWAPGMQKWLEVSSCSVFSDFQSRRANIRFRAAPGEKPQFVHTLNGSGLGVPRTFDALLETYQTESGEIVVPDALRPYMGTTERLSAPAR